MKLSLFFMNKTTVTFSEWKYTCDTCKTVHDGYPCTCYICGKDVSTIPKHWYAPKEIRKLKSKSYIEKKILFEWYDAFTLSKEELQEIKTKTRKNPLILDRHII